MIWNIAGEKEDDITEGRVKAQESKQNNDKQTKEMKLNISNEEQDQAGPQEGELAVDETL